MYVLAPPPNFGRSEHPFCTWDDGFTDEEISKIIEIGNQLIPDKAIIGGKEKDEEYSHIRNSKTSWIPQTMENMWVYDKMANITNQINGQYYGFDLSGFESNLQYTLYESDKGQGHYTWHRDLHGHNSNGSPRKLSLVLQLSDPESYEGGNLEILAGPEPSVITKKKGLVAVFPSYSVHRVTPVTKGERRTLVAWVTGPSFR